MPLPTILHWFEVTREKNVDLDWEKNRNSNIFKEMA